MQKRSHFLMSDFGKGLVFDQALNTIITLVAYSFPPPPKPAIKYQPVKSNQIVLF